MHEDKKYFFVLPLKGFSHFFCPGGITLEIFLMPGKLFSVVSSHGWRPRKNEAVRSSLSSVGLVKLLLSLLLQRREERESLSKTRNGLWTSEIPLPYKNHWDARGSDQTFFVLFFIWKMDEWLFILKTVLCFLAQCWKLSKKCRISINFFSR